MNSLVRDECHNFWFVLSHTGVDILYTTSNFEDVSQHNPSHWDDSEHGMKEAGILCGHHAVDTFASKTQKVQ